MPTIPLAVLLVGSTGLISGIVLVLVSKFFATATDERIEKISDILPGANCGACGYGGCDDYAHAIVTESADPNLCSSGGADVLVQINNVMGTNATSKNKPVAIVACTGFEHNTSRKYDYNGLPSCAAAVQLSGGNQTCAYACLGFGDCAKACKFDAICLVGGIAVINRERCVGCRNCVAACPKNIITMIDSDNTVFVTCSNKNKGSVAMKVCKESCIGCGRCKKECLVGAIEIVNNLAVIDQSLCTRCGACAVICPKKTITHITKDSN